MTSFCFLLSVCFFQNIVLILLCWKCENCFGFTRLRPIPGFPKRGISVQHEDCHRNSRGMVHGCGNLTNMRRGFMWHFRGGARIRVRHPDCSWHVASLRNFISCNISPSSKRKQTKNARCLMTTLKNPSFSKDRTRLVLTCFFQLCN